MSIKDHPEPIPPRHRKVYTKEFKESAVRLADEKGAREAGVIVRMSAAAIRTWRRELRAAGPQAFPGHGVQSGLEAEVARLRRENAQLMEEHKILKGFQAFVWAG